MCFETNAAAKGSSVRYWIGVRVHRLLPGSHAQCDRSPVASWAARLLHSSAWAKRLNWVVLAGAVVFSSSAIAEVPLSTVRALLTGESVSIRETLAVADEFRTGVGPGVWQSDCLAKYFYKLGIDAVQSAPQSVDAIVLAQASDDYAGLVAKQQPCQLYLTGAKPGNVPLNYLVMINGQTPAVVPNPDPLERPTVPGSSLPVRPAFLPVPAIAGIFVPTRQTMEPQALPPPVDYGQSLESAMANPLPPVPGTNAPRSRVTAAQVAPIIIVKSSPGECQANWTQYFVLQEFMRDFAKMSFFIYAGSRPIQRASDYLVDLEDRIKRAPIDVKQVLSWEKPSALESRDELIDRRARKRELADAGYRRRADLHDSFFRHSKLSEEKLESEDFEFEVWERGGYFVVVFRGTSLTSGWISDARQILNIDVGKGLYEYSDRLIKYLINDAGIDRSRIATTGHSLGGGLAVYSHLRNDTDFAIVFNPAELSSENQVRAKNLRAAERVVNYMSYVPGTDAADFVSQGTFVAKEMVKLPFMELPDGKLYGKRFYLPIPVSGSKWGLAKRAGYVGGVGAVTPYGLGAGIVAAVDSASKASDSRVATAKTRGTEVAGAMAVRKFLLHPVRSTVLGGIGGVTAYNKVAPMENIAWGIFQMHIMQPLEAAAATRFFDAVSLACAGPATPAFVKQQVDVTSRVGNFLKLADKVSRAPEESTPARRLK